MYKIRTSKSKKFKTTSYAVCKRTFHASKGYIWMPIKHCDSYEEAQDYMDGLTTADRANAEEEKWGRDSIWDI